MTEAELRDPSERPLFVLSVGLNLAIVLGAVVLVTRGADWLASHALLAKHAETIRAVAIAGLLAPIALVFTRNLRLADLHANGIRISPTQLPELHAILRRACERLSMPLPEFYLLEKGLKEPIRAYSTLRRNIIVVGPTFLGADLPAMRDVYEFQVGHELGRLRLGHTHWVNELLLAYLDRIPQVRRPLRRARTRSRDRYGAYLAPNGVRGLLVLASGRRMLDRVNVNAYLDQITASEKGLWYSLDDKTDEMPDISERILNLYRAGLFDLDADRRRFAAPEGTHHG